MHLTKKLKIYIWPLLVLGVILISTVLQLAGYPEIADGLIVIFSCFIALKLAVGMVKDLRSGHYGVDILAITAIGSTLLVGEYWASIVIVLMMTGGEALEDYAGSRAKEELSALLARAPQTAHRVAENGDITDVRPSEIKVGDTLLVKPGEVIPVDGVMQSEAAEFDESSLTGESLPVEHKMGEEILSGSVNGGNAVYIKALRTAQDSQYQQIVDLVKAAASTEAPFVRLADRYAVPFTLVSFAIAGFAWAASGDPLRFAQVLVVATPCPLLLGAPIALISGMSRAAKHGIIVKSGAVLEKLAEVKAVAFDKTGTLTYGAPEVHDIRPAEGFGEDKLLTLAASVEQQSSHVLAHALVIASQSRGLKLKTPTHVEETVAQGVSAQLDKNTVLVGKISFLKSRQVNIPDSRSGPGETSVYIAIDGKFAGQIVFSDKLREESPDVIRKLKKLNIFETIMLTGDSQTTAELIAKQTGIHTVKAECRPIDKVNEVHNLKTRPVLMVGDGVNDAPVLAAADVGLAMGARGSTAASETADVVVLVDNLSKVTQTITIAKDTITIALQTVWIGIAASIVLMLIASTGVIPAVVGAVLQEVIDVIVIINALRAHGSWKKLQR